MKNDFKISLDKTDCFVIIETLYPKHLMIHIDANAKGSTPGYPAVFSIDAAQQLVDILLRVISMVKE